MSAKISGFFNYNEVQQHVFGQWKAKLQDVYARHGFVVLHPRPAESAETLRSQGGLSHEVYQIARMTDGQLTDLALPFDRTVPLALWIHQHANEVAFPYKRQNIDISWRAERAQAGRFRAFYQADVDIVGPHLSSLADVECISTLYEGLCSLGFKDFTMNLNHIGVSKAMIKSLDLPEEKLKGALRLIDKLDKISKEEVVEGLCELEASLDKEKVAKLVDSFKFQGSLDEFVMEKEWGNEAVEAKKHLQDVFKNLSIFGVNTKQLQFCPGMVRGLDYYTGVVFETFLAGEGRQFGSVASGGRFDQLVSGLGGEGQKEFPGVGGSIGLTRLFDIYQRTLSPVEKEAVFKKRSDADCVIIYHDEAQKEKAVQMAKQLRDAGKKVDLHIQEGQKFAKKLDYVNKKGIPFAIMLFSDDVSVKNMQTGEQAKFVTPLEAMFHFMTQTKREEPSLEELFGPLSLAS